MRFTELCRFPRRMLNSPYSPFHTLPKPSMYFKKQRIFKYTAYFDIFYRNCYKRALDRVHHSWQDDTEARDLRAKWFKLFREMRIKGALEEHNADYAYFREMLVKSDIQLDEKSLAGLAAYEPRSFKSIATLTKKLALEDGGYNFVHRDEAVDRVITRDQLTFTDRSHDCE